MALRMVQFQFIHHINYIIGVVTTKLVVMTGGDRVILRALLTKLGSLTSRGPHSIYQITSLSMVQPPTSLGT